MKPEARLARYVVRHPRRTIFFAAVMALICIGVLVTRGRLDTEVLHLLPQHFRSVQGLKILNQEFSQGNEVTFALWDDSEGKAGVDMDAFAEHFGEALRKEPWVVRVMDRVPMESPEGIGEIQTLAVPLLLNLPPEKFKAALKHLEPEALADRMARKKAEIEAGSIKAEMELNLDPTGLVIEALKPMAGSFTEDGQRPFASKDGTVHVAVAVVREESLKLSAWEAIFKKPEDVIMEKVDDFRERVRASWKEAEESEAPQVLVTGRIPYVAEMSDGMKEDVWVTVIGSILMVSAVFYFGYRRLRPLIAIVHLLLLCCLIAVAAGMLFFQSLNVITMGVCAIMIAIGVDFGMLMFGAYQAKREAGMDHESAAVAATELIGRGVLFGAGTAAASFSSLLLSESPGFTQLGMLIGLGVLTAAFLMMTVFFVLMGRNYKRSERPDILTVVLARYIGFVMRHAKAVGLTTLALLLALGGYAASPWGQLKMQMDPKALEPAGSKAGFALRTITTKVPAAEIDPVLAIIVSDDEADFYARWMKANTAWLAAKERGEIRNVSSPAAFALDPGHRTANLALLAGLDFTPASEAFGQALEHEGFDTESFRPAFGLIDALGTLSRGDQAPLDWRHALPESSSWIFVLDRFLSPTPFVGMAYITPNHTIATPEEQVALRKVLEVPGVDAYLTGWTYVVADLIPWSKAKLTLLSAVMLGFIILVLAFLYRAVAPLAVLIFSLALSIGAMVALLKLTGIGLNLFNILAFPLVLGVGIDYGIYTILAVRQKEEGQQALGAIIKPILLSGFTTMAGFASLGLATHPALSGLGLVCAVGITCCLFSTLFFVLPVYLWRGYR